MKSTEQDKFYVSSFLTVYLLRVVLWLDKGDFPENVPTAWPC